MTVKQIYKRLLSAVTGRSCEGYANLYRHCSNTPLDVFIDVLVNKNHQKLVRWGRATRQEIMRAWEELFSEYCELSGTAGYRQMLSLSKEIGALSSKLMTVNLCLQVLSVRYSEVAVKTLHRFGYPAKFDSKDTEKYLADLQSVQRKSKAAEVALKQRTSEYETLMAKVGDMKLTEDYFTEVLIELSRYMGYRLKANEITVTEFVSMIRKREKEIERINNRPDGKKRQDR